MPSREGRPGRTESRLDAPVVRPGALTALLADLLRGPEGPGWELPIVPGESIGRFEIVREIGRGGFGVVYEARDAELGRSVALKAVRTRRGGTGAVGRLAEAEAAARLAHPNIVHLYDVGRTERGAFLIMELLDGETLADRLDRGVLPPREALGVAVEIARGLAHAHRQGVVHRDLKPGNVFLCADGQVKVLDFGLAQVFGSDAPAAGTPGYMAPEQARGEPGDERSDVFALGVMLVELVTGRRPDPRRTASEALEAGAVVAGAQPRRRAPAGAASAVLRLAGAMTSEDPGARLANGAAALDQIVAIQRRLEPRRWLWAGWGLAAVAVAAALAVGLHARPLPEGRLLTAIADTENETGDPELDGVSELLFAGLDQSQRFSLMARSRIVNILDEAGREVPRRIGEVEARIAAQRAEARLVIVPAVRRAGPGYELSVRALQLPRGDVRFSLVAPAAAKTSIPGGVELLVKGARRRLHEAPQEAPVAPVEIPAVAPANPEALRRYVDARRLGSEGRFSEAVLALRDAIRAAPDFLLPRVALVEHLLLPSGRRRLAGGLQAFPGAEELFSPDQIVENWEILRRDLPKLPRGERVFIEHALESEAAGSLPERLAAADRAIDASPEDPRPNVTAAALLLWDRADVVAARPYIERALATAALRPEQAIQFLLYLERVDEALRVARRWVETRPSGHAWFWLAEVHRRRGELVPALEAARRGAGMPGEWINADAFVDADALDEAEGLQDGVLLRDTRWLGLRGRMRDALANVEGRRPPADAPWARRLRFHVARANVLLPTGDREAVVRELQEMIRVGTSAFACEAWTLAVMGDLERAERIATYGLSDHRWVCAAMARAVVAWKRGDRDGALATLGPYRIAIADYYRGEMLAESGRHDEAVDALRRYRLRRGLNYFEGFQDHWNYPRSLYLEAASLERLGRSDEARRVVERLLHLWNRADRDQPLLASARALRARLSHPTASR